MWGRTAEPSSSRIQPNLRTGPPLPMPRFSRWTRILRQPPQCGLASCPYKCMALWPVSSHRSARYCQQDLKSEKGSCRRHGHLGSHPRVCSAAPRPHTDPGCVVRVLLLWRVPWLCFLGLHYRTTGERTGAAPPLGEIIGVSACANGLLAGGDCPRSLRVRCRALHRLCTVVTTRNPWICHRSHWLAVEPPLVVDSATARQILGNSCLPELVFITALCRTHSVEVLGTGP
jgi:hypothetical protein